MEREFSSTVGCSGAGPGLAGAVPSEVSVMQTVFDCLFDDRDLMQYS